MQRYGIGCVVLCAMLSAGVRGVTAEPPRAATFLYAGRLADGEAELTKFLADHPRDDQARFGLGALQFVRAVEHLAQALHRYGLCFRHGRTFDIPVLRLPVPPNPHPELLTYAKTRDVYQQWIDDLAKVEATLAGVRDPEVKLPLELGQIHLDLTGNGPPGKSFTEILLRYMGGGNPPAAGEGPVGKLYVVFDRGDVAWLRGYCHLLMAMAEAVQAYDGQEVFDYTAHMFFSNVASPYPFLAQRTPHPDRLFEVNDILDAIALVHVVRMPVKEPQRARAALAHLQQMLALSRECWKFVLAETDDDHEWLPNPKQHGVLGVAVSQEMIDSWLEFIDEAEALLAGKRLAPFWREGDPRGVNLHRVFTEPRTLDLVLWIQGTAATPYLEHGSLTKKSTWERLQRVFGGEFMGFAVWFN